MKQESILKGVLLYSISTWVNLVLGFLTVTITTRVLLPDVYGQVSIFNSITSVLMYILLLGMDGAYVRYYNELPANDTRSQLLYKNLLYTTLFCLLVGSITVCFLGEEVSKFFFNICSKILVGYIFIYTLCQMALRYLNISFRMSFRITQYNIQNILMNNIFRLLLIVTALFTNNLEYIIAILSLGMLFVLVVYLYVQRKEFIPVNIKGKLDYRVSLHGYNSYFRFALFSAPTYIIFYFNGYMSQQIVMTSLGAYAFGIFSSTNMFSQLLGAMQGGFSTFWSAYVYKNYETEKEKIGLMHNYVLLFVILAVSALVLFRDPIYIFIGSGFHSSKHFFSLILMMPVLNIVSETTSKGIDIAKKNEENLVENTLQIYHNTMEGVLERLDDNLDLLLGYRLLLTQLNGENNLEKVKAQYKMLQILKERCKDTKEADAYAVVNCKDNSILIQRNGNITYDTIKDIKKYLQKRNTFDKTPTSGWTSTVMGAQVYLVKYYNYGANTIAVLISEKRLDSLLNYNDMSIKEAAFYLTDKKGEILCASGKDWAYGEEIENLQKQDPSISIYQGSVLEDAYQMYYSVKSSEYAAYSTSGIVIFGFLVLSLLFFGTIVWYMQKEIFRPIADLFWVSRKIHSGDFRARAEYNTNSYEMEEVKQAYNDMVQTILEMRGQKYEQELRMKDVQLKYIHMQLKPHYFLNALSTINSMVYQHEEENVHTFIQAFSQNIRYMFRTGLHTVPLQDEIKNAEGYLEMQRLMYRDCFYVYMDVPEELQQYPVPQMILHTFLENIFKHVISIDSFTTVLIQALWSFSGKEVYLKLELYISQGQFSQEILDFVNKDMEITEKKDGSGIGIKNVKEVLKMMYEQDHLLYLENLEPEGTKITIWIPKTLKCTDEEKDEER